MPADHCDERVQTLCADALNISPHVLVQLSHLGKGFSVILSDMCPSVSGIGSKDAALSGELGLRALELALGDNIANHLSGNICDDQLKLVRGHHLSSQRAQGLLLHGGNLVIKLLEGDESQGLPKLCKGRFKSVSWLRPKATKSSSREIYLIAKCLR